MSSFQNRLRGFVERLKPIGLAAWDYVKTSEFKKIALTLLGGFIVVYLLLFLLILPIFTKHGDEAKVPSIVGMPLEKAVKLIEDSGLDYEVTDSVYNLDNEPLEILKQFPLPNSRVKPGRLMLLTVNKKQPPMVKVPKLVDKSLYQAKSILRSWKLRLGEVRYIPGEADAADNIVLKAISRGKKLEEGEEIEQGSKVDLYISQGLQNQKVEVPNLVGMTYDIAEAMLRDRDLSVGGVAYRPEAPASQAGKVISQYPDSDSVMAGTSIDLIIGGKEPEETESNDE